MRKALGAVPALLLVAVAACGGHPADSYKKTDPVTIATDAHAALTATTGLHVTGTIQLGNETVSVDVVSDATGAATGTTVIQGQTVQVLVTGGRSGTVYVKGDSAFWGKVAAAYSSRLTDRWVTNVPALPDVLRQLTLPKLIANEAAYAWEKETPTLVGTSTVNGTPTVQISVVDGASGAAEVLDVAATEPHHVLREAEASQFTLTFDQFGATVSAATPAAADVVDFTKVVAQK
jgi:hypothetical protein